MDKTTHEVRLAQWRQIIEQCQAQPAVSFVEIPFQPAGGWDADCIFHTRMRDFYDIYILTEQDIDVNAHVLAQA